MGPLQFMVIGFDGNHFRGDILPEIQALREKRIIRVLDLVFVRRDGDGSITKIELSDLPGEDASMMSSLDEEAGDWFAQDDIEKIGDSLAIQTSVAMVLIEHLWAQTLGDAIRNANGSLLAEGMVPRPVVDEVEAQLAKAG